MKKIIFIVFALLLFAINVSAQTTAAAFTETTKGQVNKFSQDGYAYGETTVTAPGDTAYYILSTSFGTSSTTYRNSFMGSKILVGVNITVAFLDVASTLVLQISLDGTNWYDLSTLDSDITPNVTGVQTYLADFTSTYAPFARLKFNASGLDIGTTGRVKFLYAIPL